MIGSSRGAGSLGASSVEGLIPRRLELVEQHPEAFGKDGDLDLLENDRDDLAGSARLKEERPVAGLADGAGHEPVGWVEDEEASRHLDDGVPAILRLHAPRSGGPGGRPAQRQPTVTWIV